MKVWNCLVNFIRVCGGDMETMRFRGEYSFLSNFQYFDKPMQYGDLTFPTNEHFYVAMKTLDQDLRKEVSEHPLKGLKAFGNTLPLREDWDDIKDKVMEFGLRYKYSWNNPRLRRKLSATKGIELVEGNWHGDDYWGFCLKTGQGENRSGKLHMKIRDEIEEG